MKMDMEQSSVLKNTDQIIFSTAKKAVMKAVFVSLWKEKKKGHKA